MKPALNGNIDILVQLFFIIRMFFFSLGFTLDKESNTIAIICQDLIVVLAFDTRERLIQWQVKIYNHLGEGEYAENKIFYYDYKFKIFFEID